MAKGPIGKVTKIIGQKGVLDFLFDWQNFLLTLSVLSGGTANLSKSRFVPRLSLTGKAKLYPILSKNKGGYDARF